MQTRVCSLFCINTVFCSGFHLTLPLLSTLSTLCLGCHVHILVNVVTKSAT